MMNTMGNFRFAGKTVRLVILILLSHYSIPTAFASEPIPAQKQQKPVALVGGTIHTVTGGVIEQGIIFFDKGTILSVGKNVDLPPGTEKIDVSGKHIYPALINAASYVGLQEIEAVRATLDMSETGRINPNVRTEVAVNPESEVIPTIRANGVAVSHVVPSGSLIAGRTAVMMMDGWTNQEMILKAPAGMYIVWPSMSVVRSPFARQTEEEQKKNIEKNIAELRAAFDEARSYQKAKANDPVLHATDIRWEAMIDLFDKKIPLIVQADEVRQIQSAVDFAQEQNVRLIIHGGKDAWKIAPLLKERSVGVIVGPVHDLPRRRWEDYDTPFTLPKKLHDAGILFAISGEGNAAMGERSIGFQAATASAYGLPKDEAFKALTMNAARLLGVEKRIGSLEEGKDATLIVTTGDPLEIVTTVELMYIQGKRIDLRSRHTQLWKKYEEKYRQLGIHR